MDKVLLVARREYLAYVTAWGFWLGLMFTPLILGLSIGLPFLIQKTQPARYFTVIDPQGEFQKGLMSELNGRQDRAAISILSSASPLAGGDEFSEANVEKYKALREAGASVDEAMQQTLPAARTAVPSQNFVFVEPPANTIQGLSSYLLGETEVDGPLGPRPLYGAFIVLEDRIEYWSNDVVTRELMNIGAMVSEDIARDKAYDSAGIDRTTILDAIKAAPPVEPRSPSVASSSGEISFADQAPFFIALILSGMLWLLIFSVVNYLLTGTIEERSNKIFDTLLTSISLGQMLTGKLLGVLGLSLTLIGVWSMASLLFALMAQNQIPPDIAEGLMQVASPKLLVPTLISFALGYLMYGALFLALGSLCDTIQEAQALLSPVFIVMMIPLLMIPVAINSPDSALLGALSWVPLLTPFLLILRIPNDLPFWLFALQILWMAGFTLFVIWGGTRVYRAGAVHGMGMADLRRSLGQVFGSKPKA